MEETSAFAERLAALLRQRGLTQVELAARVGVTRAAMSRYVSGDREPRFVTLVRIADELGVHVDELLAHDGDSVETAFKIVARTTLNEQQKAQLRLLIGGSESE